MPKKFHTHTHTKKKSEGELLWTLMENYRGHFCLKEFVFLGDTLDLFAPDPFRIMLSKGGSLWKL